MKKSVLVALLGLQTSEAIKINGNDTNSTQAAAQATAKDNSTQNAT